MPFDNPPGDGAPDDPRHWPYRYYFTFEYWFTPGPMNITGKPAHGLKRIGLSRKEPVRDVVDFAGPCQECMKALAPELKAMPGDNFKIEVDKFQRFEKDEIPVHKTLPGGLAKP